MCSWAMLTSVDMSRPRTIRERSSAKAVIGSGQEGKLERRLSRTRFHRKGERTPPWGQPETASIVMEHEARERMVFLVEIRAVIQFVMVEPTPADTRASLMAEKEILSKAPSMSRNTPRAKLPAERASSILEVIRWMAAFVEEPLVKPNWQSLRAAGMLRSSCRCHNTKRSRSLRRWEERDMMRNALGDA